MDYKELYNKYAQESYQNSFDHGFWEEGEAKSKGEMVMLMISEVSEAQEANRKDHRFLPEEGMNYTKWCFDNYERYQDNPNYEFRFAIPSPAAMNDDELFSLWFENKVKNTEQDELADVAIRIMDFDYGWRCQSSKAVPVKLTFTDNFSEGLLVITEMILNSYYNGAWGFALNAVVEFSERWDVDLVTHIALKQRYNRGRPYKHLKKY